MPWTEVTIGRAEQHGAGLLSLSFDLVIERFVPGQFVNLGLDLGGERVRRSYSIASAPGQPLELLVSEVPDGQFSPHLFSLKPGELVWVDTRPLGFFTLDHVPACDTLWLVATGTGLSPYLSMLRAGAAQRHGGQVVLVHGVRRLAHLAYEQELRGLCSAEAPGVTYVPVVSRELPPSGALTGRITGALEAGHLEQLVGRRFDSASHVMLCGNPQMIEDMQAALAERGLRKHRRREPGHITVESYW